MKLHYDVFKVLMFQMELQEKENLIFDEELE